MNDGQRSKVPALRGPLAAQGFVAALGESSALFGPESGPFEWWAWPLQGVDGLRPALFPAGARAPLHLAGLRAECEVTPARVRFVHRGSDFVLRQELLSDPERAISLWTFELEAEREFELELSLRCRLRPQWPAGLGGELVRLDPQSGALGLADERGRAALVLGAPGARLRSAPDGRGLPRDPLRLRAPMRAGRPLSFAFVALQSPHPGPAAAALARARGASAGLALAGPLLDRAVDLWREVTADPGAVRQRTLAHWARRDALRPAVECDRAEVERAVAWAQANLERAQVAVPGVGRSLLAGLGHSGDGTRPGLGWFLPGEALVAARALCLCGDFPTAATVLRQAAARPRADGHLADEVSLSAGLCDWFGEFPYAYARAQAGPQFVPTLERYLRASGDLALAESLLPAAEGVLAWIATVVDAGGLADTRRAGLGTITGRPLSEAIGAEAELHGALIRAARAGLHLAALLREHGSERGGPLERRAAALLPELEAAFERFWSEEHGRYAFALDLDGERRCERSSLVAPPLAAGAGEGSRAARSVAQLAHPELDTDWGLRRFGAGAAQYHPHNRETGGVWAQGLADAALAAYRVGHTALGHQWLGTLLALEGLGGRGLIEECLTGDRAEFAARRVPLELRACAALLEALLGGALGLELQAPRGARPAQVTLRLQTPLPWPRLALSGLRVGGSVCDLHLESRPVSTAEGEAATELSARLERRSGPAVELELRAVAAPRSAGLEARCDGAAVAWEERRLPTDAVEFAVRERGTELGLRFEQGPHLVLPRARPALGQPSRGVRVLELLPHRATLSGTPAEPVELVLHSDRPCAVVGAEPAEQGGGRTLRSHFDSDGRLELVLHPAPRPDRPTGRDEAGSSPRSGAQL
jgi:glycogen debranching enzyme